MRAAVARGGAVAVEDVDEPRPGTGQVLVAPRACGICGSDLHLVDAQAAMPELVPPVVLGHEYVAEVLDYGPGTGRGLPPGSLVTSVPYLDGQAGPQLIGLEPAAPGALGELMILQESRLLPIPDGVPVEHAAFTEPLAVGVHAVAAAGLQAADISLVVGCGPVGLSVLAALKAAGHGPVVAADFSPARRALAELAGADLVVDPKQASPYTAWTDLAGSALPSSPLLEPSARPNTVVFECVGVPGVLPAVMDSVPPHTRIVVVGVCTQPDTIYPAVGITKELAVRFVFAYRPEEFVTALDWITDGTVDVGPLITAVRGIDDVADAFAELRRPEEHCKILLTPTGAAR